MILESSGYHILSHMNAIIIKIAHMDPAVKRIQISITMFASRMNIVLRKKEIMTAKMI